MNKAHTRFVSDLIATANDLGFRAAPRRKIGENRMTIQTVAGEYTLYTDYPDTAGGTGNFWVYGRFERPDHPNLPGDANQHTGKWNFYADTPTRALEKFREALNRVRVRSADDDPPPDAFVRRIDDLLPDFDMLRYRDSPEWKLYVAGYNAAVYEVNNRALGRWGIPEVAERVLGDPS